LVPNEKYLLCKTMKSQEARKYFGLSDDEEREPSEEWIRTGCGLDENVTCPVCEGAGKLEYNDEDWELTVIPNEDAGD
jgi:hypothetical protein